jgi:hypothetical protein
MRTIRLAIFLSVLWALCFPITANAQGPTNDVILGKSFTLHKGETYSSDLVAIGSTVVLENGSLVEGNVVLLGGSLEASGKITGDLASIGGTIHLMETAEVGGNLASLGEPPQIDTGAKVQGEIRSVAKLSVPGNFSFLVNPSDFSRLFSPAASVNLFWANPLFEFTALLFRVLLLSAIAVLVMLFLPVPTERIARGVVQYPWLSLAVGFFTFLASIALAVIFLITCCLIPIGFLGMIILGAAILIGWVGMGLELGKRIAPVFHTPLHPAAQAGIGTMVLTFLANGVWYLPCLGSILVLLALSFGLGAVVVTRFGGRDYTGGKTAAGSTSSIPPATLPDAAGNSGSAGSPPTG